VNLTKAILDKEISSSELLELYVERYERLNPNINAIVATNLEDARNRTHQADEALSKGENWGPLHGLPITIKDSFEVAGMPCTSGSPDLKDYRPTRNAVVVDDLIAAGAVVFGKTNLPIFTVDFQTYNDVYGQTNNPWDVSKVPGGSSGGSAAALAAGLTGLDIGSDASGSIRIPAHFCGVYGHRPSINIVPLRGHIPPIPGIFPGEYTIDSGFSVAGPMARSAEDLALAMDLITRPESFQQTAWKVELPASRRRHLKEYRVGIWLDDPACPVDSQVGDCLQATVDRLSAAGAKIEDKRPDIDMSQCYGIHLKMAIAASSKELSEEQFQQAVAGKHKLGEDDLSSTALWVRGTVLSYRDFAILDYERTIMRHKWAEFFKDFDVLLCPAAPVTAFPHDHSESLLDRTLQVNGEDRNYPRTVGSWACLTCVSYLPATVAPTGLAKNGLPVGVQIVGPYLEDRTPIHLAGLMETTTGGFSQPPGFE